MRLARWASRCKARRSRRLLQFRYPILSVSSPSSCQRTEFVAGSGQGDMLGNYTATVCLTENAGSGSWRVSTTTDGRLDAPDRHAAIRIAEVLMQATGNGRLAIEAPDGSVTVYGADGSINGEIPD